MVENSTKLETLLRCNPTPELVVAYLGKGNDAKTFCGRVVEAIPDWRPKKMITRGMGRVFAVGDVVKEWARDSFEKT
jgi:hypothetical protein